MRLNLLARAARKRAALLLCTSIVIGASLCMPTQVSAQSKRALKYFEQQRYSETVRVLKGGFYSEPADLPSGILLAKAYYKLGKYQEALDVLHLVNVDRMTRAEDVRFYADVQIATDDFSGAYLTLIQLISKFGPDDETFAHLDKTADLIAWDSIRTGSEVRKLKALNSYFNEYAPYLNKKGELWYVTDQNTLQVIFPAAFTNQNIHMLYRTQSEDTDSLEMRKPSMLVKRKDYYYHDGPIAEWPGRNQYAQTLRDIDGLQYDLDVGIYFTGLTGDEDDVVPFRYNGKHRTGHPTFSPDGNRMYFSSDRKGGLGNMDLWYSDWKEGEWQEPVNMGPEVNTPGNEVYPNLNDYRLYYASDRSDLGYGGLDLYYVSLLDGEMHPYNLRTPINSAFNDFSIAFYDAQNGYFASDRVGGAGGDDIYAFRFVPNHRAIDTLQFKILPVHDSDMELMVYDMSGARIATGKPDHRGVVSLPGLSTRNVYKLDLKGGDPGPTTVYMMDASGKEKAVYSPFSDSGSVVELLDNEVYSFGRMAPEDTDARLRAGSEDNSVASLEGSPMDTLERRGVQDFRIDFYNPRTGSPTIGDSMVPHDDIQLTAYDINGIRISEGHPGDHGIASLRGLTPGKSYLIQPNGARATEVQLFRVDREGREVALQRYFVAGPEVEMLGNINFGMDSDSLTDSEARLRYYRAYMAARPKEAAAIAATPLTGSVFHVVDKYFGAGVQNQSVSTSRNVVLTAYNMHGAMLAETSPNQDGLASFPDISEESRSLIKLSGPDAEEVEVFMIPDNNEPVALNDFFLTNPEVELLDADSYALGRESGTDLGVAITEERNALESVPGGVNFRTPEPANNTFGFLVERDLGQNGTRAAVAPSTEAGIELAVYDLSGAIVDEGPVDSLGRVSLSGFDVSKGYVVRPVGVFADDVVVYGFGQDGKEFTLNSFFNPYRDMELLDDDFYDLDRTDADDGHMALKATKHAMLNGPSPDHGSRILPSEIVQRFLLEERQGLTEDEDVNTYRERKITLAAFDINGEKVAEGRPDEFGVVSMTGLTDRSGYILRVYGDDAQNIRIYELGDEDKAFALYSYFNPHKDFELLNDNAYAMVGESAHDVKADLKDNSESINSEKVISVELDTGEGSQGNSSTNAPTQASEYVDATASSPIDTGGTKTETTLADTSSREENAYSSASVYYDFDSYALREESKANLDAMVQTVLAYPDLMIKVIAHTDSRGPKSYNMVLSDKRANSAMEYLVQRGVDPDRISARGVGEAVQEDGQNGAERPDPAQYRRADLILMSGTEAMASKTQRSTEDTAIAELVQGKAYTKTTPTVYYGFDSYTLRDAAKAEIDSLVQTILRNPGIEVKVVAHTDSRGPEAYNLSLSEKRANAVVNYLVERGVESNRLTAIGKGESELVNGCGNGKWCPNEDHAKNRRTDFVFVRNSTASTSE